VTQRQVPGLSREAIVSDLRALGLEAGALVLVHSSLSSLGWVESGAQTVVDVLLEAVSPDGTVLVPTLTGTIQDGPEHPPIIDPRATPCWTGTIPETFRRLPSARRSRHPTHSVAAVGPATAWLIAGHEYCATPCAANSPYGRLADAGGFILLLGVTHERNTSLHMVEELADVPYHMQREPAPARVARPDGAWEEIPTRLHLWRWERAFPRVEPLLLEAGAQRTGMVGQAHSRLVDARAMRDLLLPLLRRGPLFLLSDAARAAYEQSSA
jgi:aminoglycoside 3-N-acetyltransferase